MSKFYPPVKGLNVISEEQKECKKKIILSTKGISFVTAGALITYKP